MKNDIGLVGIGLLAILCANVYAEELDTAKDWRGEISSDVQEIKQDRETNRSHAQDAIHEERDLRHEIHEAAQSGDHDTAKSLRGELNETRRENIQEKRQDLKDLKQARQELRSDVRDARKDGDLPPRRFNPPGYNPPGAGPGNPPGYNPPGPRPGNPPGYNPPGAGHGNPPGYNPPGVGPGNPPVYNPPGANVRPVPPPRERDAQSHRRGREEGRGDFRDPGQDRHRGPRDDRRGDDGKRYLGGESSNGGGQGNHDNARQNPGVRDHGAGVGKGQGGMHRR